MPANRTFDHFLSDLRAFESGIDTDSHAWYSANYNTPVVTAPCVTAPGRVVRDDTGSIEFQRMTVAEYFVSLGVSHLFDDASVECLRAMQYAVVNCLGFIGYQIGEAILITTRYYVPEKIGVVTDGTMVQYERFYCDALESSTWRGGCREMLHRSPGASKEVLATDVNRWRGTFTGKHGVFGLGDLKKPERQDLVIREILHHNYERTYRALAHDAVKCTHRGPTTSKPEYSVSGVLAAAHLCGADAVINFVRSGRVARDEFGTSLPDYLHKFSGYDTPYGR